MGQPPRMTSGSLRVLLIGPYDPHCGEYTFLAPPLGVWRLAGVLESSGVETKVFDPNCCREPPQRALERELLGGPWNIVGVSTTGMTLRFDLELAHIVRRVRPEALIVAGGMEATFRPDLMFELGPFDLIVLGEGERPLLELVARLRAGQPAGGIAGTASRSKDGNILSIPPATMNASGVTRRTMCASSKSNRSVIPVVETPTMSHAPLSSTRSSARCGGSRQQFGSKTLVSIPAASSTPASRQTPSGGARKVNSPQCGSYGPISNAEGDSEVDLRARPMVFFSCCLDSCATKCRVSHKRYIG